MNNKEKQQSALNSYILNKTNLKQNNNISINIIRFKYNKGYKYE